MAYLKIHPEKITPEAARELVGLCPFSAIQYENGKLEINAGCKMCRMCVRKGPAGAITYEEDAAPAPEVDKSAWRGVAVFAELRDGEVHPVTLELLGKARELAAVTGHPVLAVLIGSGVEEQAKTLLRYGADKVYLYDDPVFRSFLMDPYAGAFEDFVEKAKPSSILVGATNMGRSLAPRVAAHFRTGLTADCTVLEMRENTDLVQIRPAFGGNIMAQIINPAHRPQFCTVRYKIFSAPEPVERPTGTVERMPLPEACRHSRMELLEVLEKPRQTDISEAQVIVAVGRGVKSQADLALAQKLADAVGGQLACTRPLVEAGWFDVKHQIGLSGRTVNAKLIITLGVSGSVQFAAGMRGCGCIVAVNKDPAAPIFDIAHYGLAGDWYTVVPALLKALGKGGAQ